MPYTVARRERLSEVGVVSERERDFEASYRHAHHASRVEASLPPQTPAEHAREIIVGFARQTVELHGVVIEVRAARDANDLERWTQVRTDVEKRFASAQRALERARTRSTEATPEVQEQFVAAQKELERVREAFRALGEAPTGFTTVADEAEILATFDAPLEGGFRIGFEKKETALKAQFDRLTPADRRVLAERMRKPRPNDRIAAAFGRFTEARRQSLLDHLASSGRHQARQREAPLRGQEDDRSAPPDDAPQAVFGDPEPATENPIIAAEPEPLDTKLRRILEAGASDAAIESAFADVVADLDGTTRRELAKRLETYRPGSGDDIAARFIRLDRSLRLRICTGLRAETGPDKLPDEIRGELESATGRSLAHVNVHAGTQGNAIAASHGARAVAVGSDIYMGEGQLDATTAAGRELLAHEVAHVVQAEGRAHPAAAKRDDGDVTEAAEVEADDFAARFRDEGTGASFTPTVDVAGATMRAPATAAKTASKVPPARAPEAYLAKHHIKLWRMVWDYLQRVNLPEPAPRLKWRDDTTFITETVTHLRQMDLLSRREGLAEVLYPVEPYALISPLLPPDAATWVPTIASALAQLFEQAIGNSLRRLGPRWVELAEHKPEREGVNDESKSLVAESSIVASAPIDIAVRHGLTAGAVVEITGNAKLSKPPRALRPVTVKWQGERDRALWNWVRADRDDASPEEVAAALWHDRVRPGAEGPTSYYAYGLVQMGPMFAIPPSWARQFKDAREHAPAQADDETGSAQLVALAGSEIADELALAQAAPDKARTPGAQALVNTLADSADQLAYLRNALGPWQLAGDVVVGQRWVATKQAAMPTASDEDRAKWAPVIQQQGARLYRITEGVAKVLSQTKKQDPHSRGSEPLRRILQMYARAAATSFLGEASERLIETAAGEQSMLTLTALRASTTDLALVMGSGQGVDTKQYHRAEQIAAESRSLQSQLLAGKRVDTDRLELTMLQAQELALHVRVEQIRGQLQALRTMASAAGQGAISTIIAQFHGQFRSIDSAAAAFEGHLQMVMADWDHDTRAADLIKDPEQHAEVMRRLRQTALAKAQARFDAIKTDDKLVKFLREGAKIIEKHAEYAKWATICVQLLAMIGISFVASAAGGAVTRMIGSWGASAEALEAASLLARAAHGTRRAVGFGVGTAVEAAGNTAGQHALGGGPQNASLAKTFVENWVIGGAGGLLLSKIGHDLEFAKNIERQTHSLWARVKTGSGVMLAKGVTLSSHVIINVAIAHVAHKMIHAGAKPTASESELAEWFMQGVSIGLGRYVSGAVRARRPHYEKLAALRELAAAKHLLRDADTLLRLAMQAETKPDGELAIRLLASQRKLLADELAVLEAASADPAKRKALDMTEATLRGAKKFVADQIAQMNAQDLSELPLHIGGLRKLVPDAEAPEWSGSRAQIQRAITAAKRAGIEVDARPDADGVWRQMKIAGRPITLHERADSSSERHAEPHTRDWKKPSARSEDHEAPAKTPDREVDVDTGVQGPVDRYGHLTAKDFTSVRDPKLREIREAAQQENERAADLVRKALDDAGIKDVEIQYRAKSAASILGKLLETPGMKVSEIKDLSGIRINIKNVRSPGFSQHSEIVRVIQAALKVPSSAIKDYNAKPNSWGYTGRVHLFAQGKGGVTSEIQVGSKDLSEFIETKFTTPDGRQIELHDLTGYKGELYGLALPKPLQDEYTRLIREIGRLNRGGRNVRSDAKVSKDIHEYKHAVQEFMNAQSAHGPKEQGQTR